MDLVSRRQGHGFSDALTDECDLLLLLKQLDNWEKFARHLPAITDAEITEIKKHIDLEQQLKSLASNLVHSSKVTWQQVAIALLGVEESALAASVLKDYCINAIVQKVAQFPIAHAGNVFIFISIFSLHDCKNYYYADKERLNIPQKLLHQADQIKEEYISFTQALHECFQDKVLPSLTEQPDEEILEDLLEPLINVLLFAQCLEGIQESTINELKEMHDPTEQKRLLIKKWIHLNPDASWKQVIGALVKCEQILSSKSETVKKSFIAEQISEKPKRIDLTKDSSMLTMNDKTGMKNH